MGRIEIKGRNENLRHCWECGEKLSFDEYRSGRDACTSCRIKSFNRRDRQYTGSDGSNNIDMILINKREKR